jgi:SAM-dependent methyltransferase
VKLLIIVAFAAEALVVQTSRAAEPRTFRDEASKQQEIYDSGGRKVPEGYVIGRSLLSYAFTLSPGFRQSLASLGAQDRWLDIGAGEGNAVLDYRTSKYDVLLREWNPGGGKAQVVAVSIEDRRTPRWHEAAATLGDEQIRYLHGRRLREYSAEELGRFQLITDVLGAFSYTRYPSVFMAKALSALDVNGTFYTLLQDVQPEGRKMRPFYAGSPFLTEIVKSDGSEMTVCSWLKSIGCVEVTCEAKAGSTPPVEMYRIHKVCSGVTVPPLEMTHFEAGTPPERRFRSTSASRELSGRVDTER